MRIEPLDKVRLRGTGLKVSRHCFGNEPFAIKKGPNADLVTADSADALKIEEVIARGRPRVKEGRPLFRGHYQEDPYKHLSV